MNDRPNPLHVQCPVCKARVHERCYCCATGLLPAPPCPPHPSRLVAARHDATLWVDFGDVAHGRLGEQAQYASRYVDGRLGDPNLGVGLRFRALYPRRDGDRTVDPSDYHAIQIHRNDVETFVERVAAWKRDRSLPAP